MKINLWKFMCVGTCVYKLFCF